MRPEPYEEVVPSGRLMLWVGLGLAAVVVVTVGVPLAVASPTRQDVGTGDTIALVATLVGTLVLAVGVARMRIHVRVDDVLEVRVTPFWYRRRIDPAQITSAVPMVLNGVNSAGWGIRLVPGGTALLLDNGPGVQVHVAGKWSLRFRCGDPQALVAALDARGASVR